jgi:hypothetical protein
MMWKLNRGIAIMNSKLKKSLAVAGIASGVGLAVVAGTGMVSAASSPNASSTNGQSSLIDKIASKFNLNKNDVKAVFDQDRADHQAERQTKVEDRLNQAVTDKKITSDQKDKILAKLKEIKADMQAQKDNEGDAMKDKTPAERKAAMDAQRADLEKWASDNGIPMQYLQMGGGGFRHKR